MDLGSITNKQKMVGIPIKPLDANENNVANFNPPQVTVDQPAAVSVQNIQQAADGKSGSFDLVGIAPSSGPVTVTVTGLTGNFGTHYSTSATIWVTLDPSTPGPPNHWDIQPGTIEPQ